MPRIRVLPEVVANRIAAGEVVDRPASVAKELIENALDAGAAAVTVRIEGSGARLIEVSDDGCGMDPEDAVLAFERHATSKIAGADDIATVRSFGFRGEALPSIASVSDVELITSTGAEGGGATRVRLRGGLDRREDRASRAPGTTVRIRNLFSNTPARRKFLKSDRAEEGHLRRAVIAHALARPAVAFRYVRDAEEVFDLPAGEDLPLRVARLFGRSFADELIPAEGREHGPRVSGLVSKPDTARGNRSYQYFHVNGRPVQQNLLVQAATAPYRDILPPRRYPAFILAVEIDPEFVDVNIHPTKREVRFSPERAVFAAVDGAVRRAVRSEASMGPFWKGDRREGGAPRHAGAGTSSTLPFDVGKEGGWSYRSEEPDGPIGGIGTAEEPTPSDERSWLERVDLGGVQQVAGTFLVAAGPGGVLVADQHTVHERILFEEALRRIERKEGHSQRLLFPETVEADPEIVEAAEAHADLIEASGFLVRPAGPRALLLEGTPPGLRRRDPGRLLVDFLEYLVGEGKGEKSREKRVAASIACHGAVRAGDLLTPDERRALLLRLASCDEPLRCPHGRPTFLTIPADELARRFFRP
ncbi:MAG: DNA mismatch repair endonuclease MutL [Candidatus Eisenbacteria bacterium]